MSNFKQDILGAIEDDTIQAVVIEEFDTYYEARKEKYAPANAVANQILTLPQALEVLDYEYSSSWGSQECHNVFIYSETKVYYIHEYDGSTSICFLPRNPTI